MYSSGDHVEDDMYPGALLLLAPNDGVWYATGSLPGASETHGLVQTADGTIYAGTNPGANVFKSTDGGATWTPTGDLAGASYLFDLAVGTDGAIYASTGYTGDVYKTTNGGTSWTNTGDLAGAESAMSLWASPDGTIYAGTEQNGDVFKTTNGGTSWTNTGNLASAQGVRAVIQTTGGVLYAGTRPNGIVFKSTDGGTSWAATPTMSPKPSVVRALLETTDGILYAGGSPTGDVFKSTNAGGSWTLVLDIPGNYSYILAFLQAFDGTVYVAIQTTDLEGLVYRTTDQGLSWQNTGGLALSEEPLSFIQGMDGSLYVGSDCTDGVGRVHKAGYFTTGSLVSSVFQPENGSVEYGAIDWQENLHGGALAVRVRTDTLPDMSTAPDWSLCPPVSKGIDISGLSSVDDRAPYVQYRVDPTSANVHVTPELLDISLTYGLDLTPPRADSALATDYVVPGEGVDDDDEVHIFFDEPTNKPQITAATIDQVLHLSGGHSWRDGAGGIGGGFWNSEGTELLILFTTNVSAATVAVGDTVSLDGTTIGDRWGNASSAQVILGGSFEPASGTGDSPTGAALPRSFALSQNFPNPFNPLTEIAYEIPDLGGRNVWVALIVYDMRGRIVRKFSEGEKGPGRYVIIWDGTDDSGAAVSSGVYFYVLRAGDFKDTRKMLLMK
jgi:photosystem II stability/assembly factor-like uncharacterized protein